MEEYTSNSQASKLVKEDKKKIEQVVTKPAKIKKKSAPRRFFDLFVAEEKENIKEYMLLDVLVPTIKKAIYDMFTGGLSMYLFGESRGTPKTNSSKISYASYFDRERRPREQKIVRSVADFDDVIFENRSDAEDVLRSMDEIISIYGIVSISDFYDAAGITGEYPTNNYGWKDIRNAEIMRVREGYMIKFPKALPLT